MNKEQKIIVMISAMFYIAFIAGTSFVIDGVRYFTLVDDAMISMRYAKHLAQGYGLVWNIGEAPVQGFTNPGWTLYMAFLHLFPFPASKISLAVMLTSALFLLANVIVIYKICETVAPGSRHAPALAAIITAFYFPLVFWSLRGMEVGLLVLLIDLALLYTLQNKNHALIGLFLALAVVTRLDAIIAAALISTYHLIKNRNALPLLAGAAALAAVFYFQYDYFGDLLPLTYYQKVTGYTSLERIQHGLLIFNEFASRDTFTPFLLSLAALVYFRKINPETTLLAAIFLAQCAYSIYVGGDYAEPETNAANRFITQGMPALFILFSWMTDRLFLQLEADRPHATPTTLKVNPAIPFAVITLLIISGEPWFSCSVDNAPLLKADIRRVRTGLFLAEHTPADAVIAVHAAGQIPYYSERKTIDLLGLNDPVVAKGNGHGAFYPGHNKWNYEYSIGELKPDVIADNFAPLAEWMKNNREYQKTENGLYIKITK